MRNRPRFRRIIVCFSVLLSTVGYGHDTPPEYERIFNLPREQQRDEFKKLPLDKQVDMYITAMYGHPPNTDFIDPLASNGKSAIPHMLKRLEDRREQSAKTFIILAFRNMHRTYYNLHTEEEVIRRIKEANAGQKIPSEKEEGEKYIKEILEDPGVGKR